MKKGLSKSSSSPSLAHQKITDPRHLQFPKLETFYVYRPAGPDAGLLERGRAAVSLAYYKYLLHTGLYVMTKSEQTAINLVVVVSVFLSVNQIYQLAKALF